MPAVRCPACVEYNQHRNDDRRFGSRNPYRDPLIIVDCRRGDTPVRTTNAIIEGIVTCNYDGHRRPIRIENDVIDETAPTLPISESTNLISKVPLGIKQDIEEAERDHFARSYKSAVVMCRRALGLSIEEIPGAPTGRTVGPLINWAKSQNHPSIATEPLVRPRIASLVEGIKDYGDGGAHRPETLDASTTAMVITVTVQAVNEILR